MDSGRLGAAAEESPDRSFGINLQAAGNYKYFVSVILLQYREKRIKDQSYGSLIFFFAIFFCDLWENDFLRNSFVKKKKKKSRLAGVPWWLSGLEV